VRRLFLAQQPAEQRLGDLNRDVEARDLLQRARGLLGRLPPKEQLVFLLHHVEGYTLAEVSELAGFSLATAKRRLSSANARFRKMLKREPGLELTLSPTSERSAV
jgi:RNA polymerase sigma factor (sigma-70 family)